MNIKQSYINHSGKVFFAFIIVCFMTFVLFVNSLFTRTEDSYRVAAREVVALEQKYDKYWDTEGKKLALAKEDLFKQEQVVNSKLEEISKEIEEKKKLTKKELLNEWKPTYVAYYVDNKKKKYRIIEEGIGGVEDGSGAILDTYTKPSDLFYTCLKQYNCYVTQSDREHFSRNGYLATDIGTADKNLPIRLPDFMGKEVVYTLKYVNYPKTTGATVEAFAEVDGVKIMWRIGHTHWDWDNIKYNDLYHNKQLKTGTVIAYSGGEKEESFKNKGNQGATTGKHVHIEYLMWDGSKYAPAPYRLDQTINVHKEDNSFIPTAHAEDLQKVADGPQWTDYATISANTWQEDSSKWSERKRFEMTVANPDEKVQSNFVVAVKDLIEGMTNNPITSGNEMYPRYVYVTSYNPEVKQNDSDPWTGAAGVRMSEGMIALSRDLVNNPANKEYNMNSPIKFGDKVHLQSPNENCTGDYVVSDTMNRRFKNRADIFRLNRKDNQSCYGVISVIK